MDNSKQSTDWAAHSKNSSASTESSIGHGSSCKGMLSFGGKTRIDGIAEGDVTSSGELTIGETALVRANIRGDIVRVFGSVKGDIVCESLLELYGGSQVLGNLSAPRVILHDGVTFEGSCKMENVPAYQNDSARAGINELQNINKVHIDTRQQGMERPS